MDYHAFKVKEKKIVITVLECWLGTWPGKPQETSPAPNTLSFTQSRAEIAAVGVAVSP